MPFEVPAHAGRYRIVDATLPASLADLPAGEAAGPATAAQLVRATITIENGRFAAIDRAAAPDDGLPVLDAKGGMVLPRFVDIHTHIDKGHIFARAPNPDGTFFGALTTVMADREANWSADDVRARMDFALRCAFHHGTGALRTHLDSHGKQTAISWPVFDEMRREWKGRIELQAAAIFLTTIAIEDEPAFRDVLDHVCRFGGVLGGVTYRGEKIDERLDRALDRTIEAAKAHGLDLDFHVDESASDDARSLERIADAVIRNRFSGKVLAGHCCSLALMDDVDRARVTEKLGEAGISVVSLPMCNLYLQDRNAGRTPRWRGVAPLHELDAAGIATMVASDNTRDPFYAYGDLDCVEVFREATRILHFDHCERPWLESITSRPAAQMRLGGAGRFGGAGRIAVGGPADLVLVRARTQNEFLSRPQLDRLVLIDGKAIDMPLPDYAELDVLGT